MLGRAVLDFDARSAAPLEGIHNLFDGRAQSRAAEQA
jgi:hypothetical protein